MIRKRLCGLMDPVLMKIMKRMDYLRARQSGPGFQADIHPTAHLYAECVISNLQSNPHSIRVGDSSHIRGKLLVSAHGGSIRIGEYCYIGHRSEIWSAAEIIIGDRVLISHDVNIIDSSSHSLVPQERHEHSVHIITKGPPTAAEDLPGVVSAPIIIEEDVWISFGVTILRGVRIGARSVIAAHSLVTKDVPPDVLYRNKIEAVMTPLQTKHEDKNTTTTTTMAAR